MQSKKFMIGAIARALNQRGINLDLVDLEAEVDSTLTLKENYNVILSRYGILGQKKKSRNRITDEFGTSNIKKLQRYQQARDIFRSLNQRRQRIDSRKKAKRVFETDELTKKNFSKWKKNINRFDIMGIDY